MANNLKWIWAGTAFAGMLAFIVLAGFVLLAKVDFSCLKPWLERRATESLGREVSIEGGVNLELGLPPACTSMTSAWPMPAGPPKIFLGALNVLPFVLLFGPCSQAKSSSRM
jgi:hypothetical protein